MTLRLIEGFDYLPTSSNTATVERLLAALGWYAFGGTSPSIVATGRFGGKAVSWGSQVISSPMGAVDLGGDPIEAGFVGFAMSTTTGGWYISLVSSASSPVSGFGGNGTICTIEMTGLGVIKVLNGTPDNGTVIINSRARVLPLGEFFYVEIGWDLGAGILVVRVNTVPIISLTSSSFVNPHSFGNVDAIGFGSLPSGGVHQIDDMYVCDALGTDNNDFLGNVRAQWLPLASNLSTQWTSYNVSVANFTAASNSNVDDTSYVKTSIDNDGYVDLYNVSPMANTGVVFGVAVKGAYRQDDARQGFVKNAISSSGVQALGARYPTNTNYGFSIDIFETDPNTSSGWTYTTVNAMAIGPEQSS